MEVVYPFCVCSLNSSWPTYAPPFRFCAFSLRGMLFSAFLPLCTDAHRSPFLFLLDREPERVFQSTLGLAMRPGSRQQNMGRNCVPAQSLAQKKPTVQSSTLFSGIPAGCWGSSEGPRGWRRRRDQEKMEPKSLHHYAESCPQTWL